MGGDSLVWLRVVSRARRGGLVLGWRDIFDHQSVAELAAALKTRDPKPARQRSAVTIAPLTGIQRWLVSSFGTKHLDWQHQSAWLDVPSATTPAALGAALRDVARRHPVLDARFELNSASPTMRVGEDLRAAPVQTADASDPESVKAACATTRAAVRLAGPLQAAALIWDETNGSVRAWWVVHHLVVDAQSWQTLVADLSQALKAQLAGDTTGSACDEIDAETAFLSWAAETPAGDDEVDRWREVLRGAPARLRPGTARGTYGSSIQGERKVAVPRVRGDQALAATLLALADVVPGGAAGAPVNPGADVLIWVEGHGRNSGGRDRSEDSQAADLTDAVGWFTSLYPVAVPRSAGLPQVLGRLGRRQAAGHGFLDLVQQGYLPGCESDVIVNVLAAEVPAHLDAPVNSIEVLHESDPAATMPHALASIHR